MIPRRKPKSVNDLQIALRSAVLLGTLHQAGLISDSRLADTIRPYTKDEEGSVRRAADTVLSQCQERK